MIYSCDRCGHKSSRKGDLVKHLERKVVCPAIKSNSSPEQLLKELKKNKHVPGEPYVCEFCDKSFNDKSNMYRHKKICKERPQNDIKEMFKDLQENLSQQIQAALNANNTTNNNTQNNTMNNTSVIQNISINNYGQETLDHLPLDFLTSCFMFKNMSSLTENIYFDKDCPKNHTIRLKSLKNNLVKVHDEGLWKTMNADVVLDEIVNKGHNILKNHYRKNTSLIEDDMSNDEIQEVLDWLQEIWNDNVKVRSILKKEIIALLDTYRCI